MSEVVDKAREMVRGLPEDEVMHYVSNSADCVEAIKDLTKAIDSAGLLEVFATNLSPLIKFAIGLEDTNNFIMKTRMEENNKESDNEGGLRN